MIRFERVPVTPAIAEEWLGRNAPTNRLPKGSKIPMYARDMLAGNWQEDTGETVKFDTFNTLIDGQNRLMAVVLAGKTNKDVVINFDVARGLPSDAMQVIDTGASRTFADVMKISGTHDRMRSSAIVRWAISWDAGNPMSGGRFSPTHSELWDRYRKETELFDAAAGRGTDCQTHGLGTGSATGTAFYLFARINVESAYQFFDQFVSGANLNHKSPILALRNRFTRLRIERLTRQEQLAMTVKAYNLWRQDKVMDRGVQLATRGELNNTTFPKPIVRP